MSRQSDISVERQGDRPAGRLPRVAVVGRPNVGKSTLVNRILGRRAAITQEFPGVTRDRVVYQADWSGRRFELVDTGGLEPKATGLQASVVAQAERAMAEADLLLFVVDATVGVTEEDAAVVERLGAEARTDGEPDVPALAIVGRPNVGKSSLLNRLAAADLAIVDPTPGTTRDTVDSIVERAGRRYRLVDTAGMRRPFQQAEGGGY